MVYPVLELYYFLALFPQQALEQHNDRLGLRMVVPRLGFVVSLHAERGRVRAERAARLQKLRLRPVFRFYLSYFPIRLPLDVHQLLRNFPDDDLVAGAELLQLLRLRASGSDRLLLRPHNFCQVLHVQLLSHAPQFLYSELLVQCGHLLRQLLYLLLVGLLLLLTFKEIGLQILD